MKYNWTFRVSPILTYEKGIPNISPTLPTDPIAKLRALGNSLLDQISGASLLNDMFVVKNINLPFIKFETETQKTGNKVYKAYQDFDSFQLEIYETTSFATKKFFSKWQDLIFDKDLRQFKKDIPFRTCFLTLDRFQNIPSNSQLSQGLISEAVPSVLYKMEGVRLLGLEPLTLDYSTGEPLTWSANLTCDNIQETFLTVPIPF